MVEIRGGREGGGRSKKNALPSEYGGETVVQITAGHQSWQNDLHTAYTQTRTDLKSPLDYL